MPSVDEALSLVEEFLDHQDDDQKYSATQQHAADEGAQGSEDCPDPDSQAEHPNTEQGSPYQLECFQHGREPSLTEQADSRLGFDDGFRFGFGSDFLVDRLGFGFDRSSRGSFGFDDGLHLGHGQRDDRSLRAFGDIEGAGVGEARDLDIIDGDFSRDAAFTTTGGEGDGQILAVQADTLGEHVSTQGGFDFGLFQVDDHGFFLSVWLHERQQLLE